MTDSPGTDCAGPVVIISAAQKMCYGGRRPPTKLAGLVEAEAPWAARPKPAIRFLWRRDRLGGGGDRSLYADHTADVAQKIGEKGRGHRNGHRIEHGAG